MTDREIARWRAYAARTALNRGLSGGDVEDAASFAATECALSENTEERYLKGVVSNAVFRWIRDSHQPKAPKPTASYTQDFTAVEVEEFLGSLTDRERTVVKMRMGGSTLDECGKAAGLSGEGARLLLEGVGEKYKKGWA